MRAGFFGTSAAQSGLCGAWAQFDGRRFPLSWGLILSGLFAAVLLALGFNLIAPLGGRLDTLCNLAAVVSGALCIGLSDGV